MALLDSIKRLFESAEARQRRRAETALALAVKKALRSGDLDGVLRMEQAEPGLIGRLADDPDCLMDAVQGGSFELVRRMLVAGADPDPLFGDTVLERCAGPVELAIVQVAAQRVSRIVQEWDRAAAHEPPSRRTSTALNCLLLMSAGMLSYRAKSVYLRPEAVSGSSLFQLVTQRACYLVAAQGHMAREEPLDDPIPDPALPPLRYRDIALLLLQHGARCEKPARWVNAAIADLDHIPARLEALGARAFTREEYEGWRRIVGSFDEVCDTVRSVLVDPADWMDHWERRRETLPWLAGGKQESWPAPAGILRRLVVLKSGDRPADEPYYLAEVCRALGVELAAAQGLSIEIRTAQETDLSSSAYHWGTLLALGEQPERATITPFSDRDGGHGVALRLYA